MFEVRPAVLEDAEALARLNFDTWTTSFGEIVPAEWLAQRNLPGHIERFKERMKTSGVAGWFTAVAGGKIIGFADGGANRDGGSSFDGELYAIYVLKGHQGKGVGAALFRAVVKHLLGMGHKSMIVKTFADSPYRRFYEKMGGEVVVPFSENWESRGFARPLAAYCWRDLDAGKK